tara:strand:+ start:435 stop:1511 length:1077 start_codon:yes stop_codon:yes gene_type:complete
MGDNDDNDVKQQSKENITQAEIEESWHRQQEDILKDWSEQASCYRWMHMRAYLAYERKNFRFALPVIILSTITGTANFAQNSFPEEYRSWVPLIIGFFNLTAGLITTISQFMKVAELMEGHRAASIAYAKISRNIAIELSLPAKERTTTGIDYIKKCRLDFDRLIEQTPIIPLNILSFFQKNMSSIIQLDSSGSPAFCVPAILKLNPVDIYRKEMAEKEKEQERLLKENMYNLQKKREEDAINKYNENRLKILKEGILEGRLKMINDINSGKAEVQTKADKKDTMTINSITKRMAKFKNILEEDTSEEEDERPSLFSNVLLSNENTFNFEESPNDASSESEGETNTEETTIDISNNEN